MMSTDDAVEAGAMPPPAWPGPRERYFTRVFQAPGGNSTVQVWRRGKTSADPDVQVTEYVRYAPGFDRTFEPFTQDAQDYALISTKPTATSVLDLGSGRVVAQENPDENGFWPAEYYVPSWHDFCSGLPGQEFSPDGRPFWPRGQFGFVAGKCPRDAGGLRVQYLDLTDIGNGTISRTDRFGHVELPENIALRDAIWMKPGSRIIEIAMRVGFNLMNGQAIYGPGRLNY